MSSGEILLEEEGVDEAVDELGAVVRAKELEVAVLLVKTLEGDEDLAEGRADGLGGLVRRKLDDAEVGVVVDAAQAVPRPSGGTRVRPCCMGGEAPEYAPGSEGNGVGDGLVDTLPTAHALQNALVPVGRIPVCRAVTRTRRSWAWPRAT